MGRGVSALEAKTGKTPSRRTTPRTSPNFSWKCPGRSAVKVVPVCASACSMWCRPRIGPVPSARSAPPEESITVWRTSESLTALETAPTTSAAYWSRSGTERSKGIMAKNAFAPFRASVSFWPSRRSMTTASAPREVQSAAASGRRTTARTGWPESSRSPATAEPMRPLAPEMTYMVTPVLYGRSFSERCAVLRTIRVWPRRSTDPAGRRRLEKMFMAVPTPSPTAPRSERTARTLFAEVHSSR